jgi:dTDP-4-amino-4,6-dideoxygalactose transaminase
MNPYDAENSQPNFWLSCLLIDKDAMAPHVRSAADELWKHEEGKSSPGEILAAIAAFGSEGRPIWKPMHLQPIYSTAPFVTAEGNGRGKTNAYIAGSGVDVGADIFARGLCLPSDNKMTIEQQDRIIDIIHRCFR